MGLSFLIFQRNLINLTFFSVFWGFCAVRGFLLKNMKRAYLYIKRLAIFVLENRSKFQKDGKGVNMSRK
jgi:hypothetical protein